MGSMCSKYFSELTTTIKITDSALKKETEVL
jgi:hypothetical protein